jgi:hypothetical protein
MDLDLIRVSDKMMSVVGELSPNRDRWLATCSICDTTLREVDANDQGEALMGLIRHLDTKH